MINYESIRQKLAKKIDVNKATLSELNSIVGISEQLAEDIIEYRNSQGPFNDLEELKNIKGIKDKKLESLKSISRLNPVANKN